MGNRLPVNTDRQNIWYSGTDYCRQVFNTLSIMERHTLNLAVNMCSVNIPKKFRSSYRV